MTITNSDIDRIARERHGSGLSGLHPRMETTLALRALRYANLTGWEVPDALRMELEMRAS